MERRPSAGSMETTRKGRDERPSKSSTSGPQPAERREMDSVSAVVRQRIQSLVAVVVGKGKVGTGWKWELAEGTALSGWQDGNSHGADKGKGGGGDGWI